MRWIACCRSYWREPARGVCYELTMRYVIRPVASLQELAQVFDLAGAQLPQRPTAQDRPFAELARRFPADGSLMLLAEDQGRIVGGALAFRTDPAPVAGSAGSTYLSWARHPYRVAQAFRAHPGRRPRLRLRPRHAKVRREGYLCRAVLVLELRVVLPWDRRAPQAAGGEVVLGGAPAAAQQPQIAERCRVHATDELTGAEHPVAAGSFQAPSQQEALEAPELVVVAVAQQPGRTRDDSQPIGHQHPQDPCLVIHSGLAAHADRVAGAVQAGQHRAGEAWQALDDVTPHGRPPALPADARSHREATSGSGGA